MTEDDKFPVDHVVWTNNGYYEHIFAVPCFKGGSGSCDGSSPSGTACECHCHSAEMRMPDGSEPRKVADFKVAHEHYWKDEEIMRAYGVVKVPF